jgi:DNA invertase Pin-like site-specific DNA recombinase
MRVALYARVSKAEDQDPENQLLPLREWAARKGDVEVVGEYVDTASSRDTRPRKEEVLRLARLGLLDAVAFVSLDRWGRTMAELVHELTELPDRGVALISLKEGLNFDSAAGRLYAHLLAAFADFERERIRERTIAGLHRAKRRGKIRGRHPAGCGCGLSGHRGPVKPVRQGNEIVGWRYPDGAVRPVGFSKNKRPLQDGPVAKGRRFA